MHTFTAQSHARPYSHHYAGQSAAAAGSAATAAKSKLYNPRHPERTLRYQTIAENFETWFELASAGQFDGQRDHHTPKPYVRQAFRKYLECGIFAPGPGVMTTHTAIDPAWTPITTAPWAAPARWRL